MRLRPRAAGAAWLLLALLLAGAPGPAEGASVREFYFQRLGSEQGLVQQTVTALAQDPQGFVWVGTQGGLHRYDGQRFVAWRHDPRDPEGMPDSFVTALAVDGDALWIGTYSQYVVRLDLADGRFQRYRADGAVPAGTPAADAGTAGRQVRALLPQGERLWVATAAGLERLDPRSGGRDIVLRLDGTAAAAPWQSLVLDDDNALWYGSGAGLYRIGPRGGIERIGPAQPVRNLTRDGRGRLWVGRSDGLHRLSDSGRELVRAWPLDGDSGARTGDRRSARPAPVAFDSGRRTRALRALLRHGRRAGARERRDPGQPARGRGFHPDDRPRGNAVGRRQLPRRRHRRPARRTLFLSHRHGERRRGRDQRARDRPDRRPASSGSEPIRVNCCA
jgi:streptogramin lyase